MTSSARIDTRGILVLAALLGGCLASCAGPEPLAEGQAVTISSAGTVPVPMEYRMPGAPPVCPLLGTEKPPTIDGKLDEPLWNDVPRLGRMYLDSGEGPMKFDTVARFARDDTYLYFAVNCLHPDIGEVPVSKGVRDKVSWSGETVELWVDTDRAGKGYVQVIFDMSGAFTDMFAGSTKWNADISAATDVGGTGWRLEARLKIADLAGGGKVDRWLWASNVARNTRGQSGSWARIVGSYQKPDEFGLLTHSGNEVVVEDLGLGIFAPPGEKDDRVPVRIELRDLTAQAGKYNVSFAAVRAGKAGRPLVKKVSVPASGARRVLGTLDIRKAEKVRVAVAPGGRAEPIFQADLPINRLARPEDCLVSRRLTCAIRSTSPVMLTAKGGDVYLMAQSFSNSPARWTGSLAIRAMGKGRALWACPVALELGPLDSAARLVQLPAEKLTPGQYSVEWTPDAAAGGPPLRVSLDYYPDLRKSLTALLDPPRGPEVLAKMECPMPAEDRDLALAQVRIDRLAGYLTKEEGNVEIDLTRNILSSYRRLKEVVDGLRRDRKYTARRRGWFETAIHSPVDGSAQPFSLFVPYDYDKQRGRKFPLVIQLHGKGGTHGGEAGFMPGKDREKITDRFILRPLGRGKACGYWGVSGNDVINQIRQVMALYPIDPDAVHLAGGSMGGFGSFEVGCTYPDMFATCRPLCGGGWWLPLEQMRNLPTFVHHGLADTVVKPWCSIFTVAKMKHYRCPVQLYLHPGVGHAVGPAADAITDWHALLKSIRREPHPRTVVLAGDMPALKKAYWLGIARYADPHRYAYLRGTFADNNHLDLTARNVAWAKVSLPARWVDRKWSLQITAGGGRKVMELFPGQAQALYIRLDGEKLEVTAQTPAGVDDPTVYIGGGVDRLFCEGRAVRIVYGTTGGADRTAELKERADALRIYPNGFDVGGYPVLKDSEVTDQVHKTCDLILIGSPAENSVVAALGKDLPVKFAGGRAVVETDPRMQWPAKDVALSLFYRNPKAPGRRIWWLVGVDKKEPPDEPELVSARRRFGELQPDLIVLSRESLTILATAVVADGWKLARIAPTMPASSLWATPRKLYDEFAAFLKDSFPVDLSLVAVSRTLRDPQRQDWKALTVGEAISLIHRRCLIIAPVSGKDLLAWRENQTEEGKKFDQPWAGLAAKDIKPEATYQVLFGDSVASDLEPEGSYRDFQFVPETAFEAVRQRFLRRHVKP